jgi:NitT/TauT family transport system ATP-binding protein
VDTWLIRLGLGEHTEKYPQQLSGGQRQRTAIARTLALSPDLLLMDEPFSSLDAPTREGLQELMLDLWEEHHFTMVVVTHAIEEAALLGEQILFLGTPPHSRTQVVLNPGGGKACFRATPPYQAMCSHLRELLGSAVKSEEG